MRILVAVEGPDVRRRIDGLARVCPELLLWLHREAEHGARVGDFFMSIVHAWAPWTCHATLEALADSAP